MPPMRTDRPYVRPRLIATADAPELLVLEPEDAVVVALPDPAPPKAPYPVDVAAADPPDAADEVEEVAFTRVGFWAPQGCAVLFFIHVSNAVPPEV
jgi:hypothetical protein